MTDAADTKNYNINITKGRHRNHGGRHGRRHGRRDSNVYDIDNIFTVRFVLIIFALFILFGTILMTSSRKN